MAIELIITDLDGTVIDEKNQVPDEVGKIFLQAKAKGVPTIIATGRTLAEMLEAQEAIGADEYSISMNGAFIYDHYRQQTLNHQYIEFPQVKKIIRLLESFEDVFFHAYGNNQPICSEKALKSIHLSGSGPAIIEMHHATQKVVPDLLSFIESTGIEINKFYISSQNTDHLNLIKSYAAGIEGVRSLQSMPNGIEVIPTTVDKSNAVMLICNHLGIDISKTLVIGDSENDVGMLKIGGISVVMGNAPTHIKTYADWIAPSNAEWGAAVAVQRFVLAD
ncbi:MAG: HAD family hydrolase [Eubacteriales bacterium]|nr:HAD family hydrolase [Eubacteriales bacterium]